MKVVFFSNFKLINSHKI